MPKKTYFQDAWLKKFKWLEKDPITNTSFVCKWCSKTRDLSNMGFEALQRHTKSAYHKERSPKTNAAANIQSYMFAPHSNSATNKDAATSSSSSNAISSFGTASESSHIEEHASTTDVTCSEIYLVLQAVKQNWSISKFTL